MGREFLFNFFKKNSVGAEIGVFKGRHAKAIVKNVNPKLLYLIDPWLYRPNYRGEIYGGANSSQEQMDAIATGVRYLFRNNKNVLIRRQRSDEFLPTLPDRCLDWVYIDGDHNYKEVKKDLELCYLKVKVGGLITGDDYKQGHPHWGKNVVRAVMEFVRENHKVEFNRIKYRQFVLVKTG